MKLTFKDCISLYLGGYHETWKTRLWLKFRSKQYRGRRMRILLRKAKRDANKLLSAEVSKDSFLRYLPKDDNWKGGNLVVPFYYGEKE